MSPHSFPNVLDLSFTKIHDTGLFQLQMFLDRTDMSKTVDRHGAERCHVLSRSSRFLAAVLFERSPFLLNEAPFLQKTAENGKNRP